MAILEKPTRPRSCKIPSLGWAKWPAPLLRWRRVATTLHTVRTLTTAYVGKEAGVPRAAWCSILLQGEGKARGRDSSRAAGTRVPTLKWALRWGGLFDRRMSYRPCSVSAPQRPNSATHVFSRYYERPAGLVPRRPAYLRQKF